MNEEMGFLIVSSDGSGLGMALRLQAEGHRVSMSIVSPNTEMLGANLIEKSESPDYLPTIIFDDLGRGIGMTLDAYKAQGGRVFSGSQRADKLENERTFASEVFKKYKIPEPEYKEFTSWEEAEEFVRESEVRLVFKPEGNYSGNVPSYVSDDSDDLLQAFSRFKKVIGDKEPQFVLQEFIEGTCISSEAWCAKGKILSPTNHTLERKQLMCGDLGPSGGCTGNVVWRCEQYCPLCDNLRRLSPFLEESEWNGPIDINTVISKEGEIYALEFTPRFGYDAFPTLLYGLFEGDFGAFVNDCCRGDSPELPLKDGYAAGVRISAPPWPSEGIHSESGIPIKGLRKSDFTRFYPYEVGLQENQIVTSGGYGCIGVCIGHGSTIEEAFEEAYKLCDKIRLPDKQYRKDLAETFQKDYRQIERSLNAVSA